MLRATPVSVPELLTQAWICGHHAARAALPLGQLFDMLPTPGPHDVAWASHHDDILTAAASAHLAARRRASGA